jgi:putative peptidoglycan lipid II flippase
MNAVANSTMNDSQIQVSGAAFKVSLGGLVSLILGLGVQIVTAYFFGAGAEMDAFLTAVIVPLYLQLVLLGGLPFVVIPAFVNEEARGNDQDAWALANTFLRVTIVVFSLLAVIGCLSAFGIIELLAPGFSVQKSVMAAQMLAVMMFSVPFMGAAYLTAGVQNVHNHWFWPAAASAVGSAGNLLILVFFHGRFGAMTLAWGSLAAAILQASITMIPFIRRPGKHLLRLKDPRVIELGKLIAPFIFFGFFTCSKIPLERYFASTLPDGQLSFIGYASKIANIFVVLLASSIAAAIFPAMARAFAQNGLSGLVHQTDYGLKITLAVAFPAVAIISAIAAPLVSVIYERGAFDHQTTLSVVIIIPFVMVNELLFRMVNNIFSRTFYILKDTFTVNLIQSLTIIFYIYAAIELTKIWGYVGLAIAQLAQSGPALILLGWLLFRRIGSSSFLPLIEKMALYAVASLLAAASGWGVVRLLFLTSSFLQLLIGLVVAILVYLLLLNIFDHEIMSSVLEMSGLTQIIRICQQKLRPIFQSSP